MSDALEKAAREVLRQLDYARKDGRNVPVGTNATDALRAALENVAAVPVEWEERSPTFHVAVMSPALHLYVERETDIDGAIWWRGGVRSAAQYCRTLDEAKAAAERAAGVRS